MEVEVLGITGVPQDAIISIRAGASRRQAPVSALGDKGTPFRFSGGPAGCNPFKLDVLQPIGSTRLALKPGSSNIAVPIGTDGIIVNLAVREAPIKTDVAQDLFDQIDTNKDGIITRREFNDALKTEGDKPVLQPVSGYQPIPIMSADGKNPLPPLPRAEEDLRFPAAATAAKEYLERHNLLCFVRALLQTVVRERPDEPYNFIADQFRNAANPGFKPDAKQTGGKVPAGLGKLAQASLNGSLAQKLDKDQGADRLDSHEMEQAKAKAQSALLRSLSGDPEMRARANTALDNAVAGGGGVNALKGKAKDMLAAALFEDADSGEAALKAKAQEALMEALLSGQDDGSEEGMKLAARTALSTALLEDAEDLDNAKGKARNALLASLMNENEEDDDEVEDAKARARSALFNALNGGGADTSGNSADDSADDAEDMKSKARFALVNSLKDNEEEEDLDGAKAKARNALSAVLLGGRRDSNDDDDGDVEIAKEKARDALAAALAGGGDVEDAKARARQALGGVLLGSDDAHTETVKAQARAALVSSMLGEDEGDTEQAKTLARDARDLLARSALLGGTNATLSEAAATIGPESAATLDLLRAEQRKLEEMQQAAEKNEARLAAKEKKLAEDEARLDARVAASNQSTALFEGTGGGTLLDCTGGTLAPDEDARQNARDELAQALLEEKTGKMETSEDRDALLRAEHTKKQWTATKDELVQMNHALKEEVSELDINMENLQREREKLRANAGR